MGPDPKDMKPVFRIIIVAYKNGPELQETLKAVAKQTYEAFEVVIVDNACPYDCTAELYLPDARFRILTSDRNRGFAGGCNFGAFDAESTWLVTLNPDAQPLPDWLQAVHHGAERYDCDLFGSTQLRQSDPDLCDGFGDVLSIFGYCWRGGYQLPVSRLPQGDRDVLTPCAAAAIYRREAFEAVGGFDETFFCYLEDIDLGLRLRAQGSPCVQLRDALVLHMGDASEKPSPDYAIHQTLLNMPRLIRKNVPGFLYPIMMTLFISSQFWFKLRLPVDDPARQKRWSIFKEGLKRQSDAQARRDTSRLNVIKFVKFLSFNMRALRHQPLRTYHIDSAYIMTDTMGSIRG